MEDSINNTGSLAPVNENYQLRGPQYDFEAILPAICDEYINSEKSIEKILSDRGGPVFSTFYRNVWGNAEWKEMWFAAERAKAAVWDAKWDDVYDQAEIAFHNKDKNVNALKIKSDIIKTRRGHLDAKFRDREVKHVIEAGESLRESMTKARIRLEKKIREPIEGEFVESDSG